MSFLPRTLLAPVPSGEELVNDIREELGRKLEWLLAAFQALYVFFSIMFDSYRPEAIPVLLALAALNLLFIPVIRSGYGLLNLGRWGVAVFFTFPLLCLPPIAATLATPHTYGDHLPQIPLYSYALGPWLVLTCFPWSELGYKKFARSAKTLAFGVYPLYVLCIIAVANQGLRLQNLLVFGVAQIWPLVACVAGRVVRDEAILTNKRIDELQEANEEEYRNRIHDDVKNGAATIMIALKDVPKSAAKKAIESVLGELIEKSVDLSIEYRLSSPTVPLGYIVEKRLELFDRLLEIDRPKLIVSSVRPDVGRAVNMALKNLLSNAHKHRATTLTIGYVEEEGMGHLGLIDDGPGFAYEILDSPWKTLHRVRQCLQEVGGDLVVEPPTAGIGSTICLSFPVA